MNANRLFRTMRGLRRRSGCAAAACAVLLWMAGPPANAQQTIHVFKCGTSSFPDALMMIANDLLAVDGQYTLTWQDSQIFVRLHELADSPARYQQWLDANLPIIQSGNFDFAVFQTLGWPNRRPDQQANMTTNFIPDLVSRIVAADPGNDIEVLFYDKYVVELRSESNPVAKKWSGCYPYGVRFNYLMHLDALVRSGLNSNPAGHVTFGGGAVDELWLNPYFDGLSSLFCDNSHPGTMAHYVSACSLANYLTRGAFNPAGSTLRRIKMADYTVSWFMSLDGSSNPSDQALYDANIHRIDSADGYLTLSEWEAATLQEAAVRWHSEWTGFVKENFTNAAVYQATQAEIDALRADFGNGAKYNLSQSAINALDCDPSIPDCETPTEGEIADTINKSLTLVPPTVNYARDHLTSDQYKTFTKTDYPAYWNNRNIKWRDDVLYQAGIAYSFAKRCETNAAEVTRLNNALSLTRSITSYGGAIVLVENYLTPAQRDEFSLLLHGKSGYLSQTIPKFTAFKNAAVTNWPTLKAIFETFFDVWEDPDLMDELIASRFANSVWNKADNRFADAWTNSGYRVWASSHGLVPGSEGDESPAGDGIKNLMKYALGINPNLSGFQGRMDEGMMTVSGTNYFMLRYTRPEPAPSDVSYQVRAGDSLTATNWVAEITEVSSTASNSLRTITIRDTVPMSQKIKRYLMMKVTKP